MIILDSGKFQENGSFAAKDKLYEEKYAGNKLIENKGSKEIFFNPS